jgi:hypothetical protein
MYRILFKTTLLLLSLCYLPDTSARIYVCVDNNGARHYSDKKCPTANTKRTETINKLGKKNIPDSVLAFTPMIQVLKRALTLINKQTTDKSIYTRAHRSILQAERNHTNFISQQQSSFTENYSPFDKIELLSLIAAISYACRSEGMMSICGVIEGNNWLKQQETNYLEDLEMKGLNLLVTSERQNKLCNKARTAHTGGVITRNMRNYFCEDLS